MLYDVSAADVVARIRRKLIDRLRKVEWMVEVGRRKTTPDFRFWVTGARQFTTNSCRSDWAARRRLTPEIVICTFDSCRTACHPRDA